MYVAPYKSSLQNWDVNLYCCKGDNNTDNKIKGIFCCCSAHDTNNTDTHTHCDAMGNLWNCISGVNLEKAYEASVSSLKRKKNEVATFIIVRTLSPKRFTSVFSSFREKEVVAYIILRTLSPKRCTALSYSFREKDVVAFTILRTLSPKMCTSVSSFREKEVVACIILRKLSPKWCAIMKYSCVIVVYVCKFSFRPEWQCSALCGLLNNKHKLAFHSINTQGS